VANSLHTFENRCKSAAGRKYALMVTGVQIRRQKIVTAFTDLFVKESIIVLHFPVGKIPNRKI